MFGQTRTLRRRELPVGFIVGVRVFIREDDRVINAPGVKIQIIQAIPGLSIKVFRDAITDKDGKADIGNLTPVVSMFIEATRNGITQRLPVREATRSIHVFTFAGDVGILRPLEAALSPRLLTIINRAEEIQPSPRIFRNGVEVGVPAAAIDLFPIIGITAVAMVLLLIVLRR